MDNEDGSQYFLLALHVPNKPELHVVNVNHIILSSYHANMNLYNFLMNGISPDGLLRYVADTIESISLLLGPIHGLICHHMILGW